MTNDIGIDVWIQFVLLGYDLTACHWARKNVSVCMCHVPTQPETERRCVAMSDEESNGSNENSGVEDLEGV